MFLLFLSYFQLHVVYAIIFFLFQFSGYILYIDYNDVAMYIINNKNRKQEKSRRVSKCIHRHVVVCITEFDRIHASIYSYFKTQF